MTDLASSESVLPSGLRVLIIEDMWLVAQDLAAELKDRGCHVAGPAGQVDKGMAIAEGEPLDGALLDINLGTENSFPIAAVLLSRGIPFVFITGYDLPETFPEEFVNIPRLQKPIKPTDLSNALAAFAGQSGSDEG